MQATPRAFATSDIGGATTSVTLIGRVAGRWRLLGAIAGAADASPDLLLELLGSRLATAHPELAQTCGVGAATAPALPRLEAWSREPDTLVVLASTERALRPLVAAVARSGWRCRPVSADRHDAAALTGILLDPSVSGVVVAAADPPGGDERGALGELAALVVAAGRRRPDLLIVAAGSLVGAVSEVGVSSDRVIAVSGSGPSGVEWPGLADRLAAVAADPHDSRQAIGRAAAGLAGALDRRVELVEVGFNGGLRASATGGRAAGQGTSTAISSAEAALVPPEIDEAALDRIQHWSTLPFDRHRLRDRLLELREAPWADVAGEGVRLRLTAARAALTRLIELTPELSAAASPDLVVIAGGAFAPAPAGEALLAVADVLRRPAAVNVAFDHARLLGPLGTVEDAEERDRLIADLAGDLLVPLGGLLMPAGIHGGRRGGRLTIDRPGGRATLGLEVGALERVSLPAGERASLTIEAAEPVVLGSRGRRISVEIAGGVAGLLVDLRDVPLRLPDRREPRRELLNRWQVAVMDGQP